MTEAQEKAAQRIAAREAVWQAFADGVSCPKCGQTGADYSPYQKFMEDELALRCLSCRHVWSVPNEDVPGIQ